MYESNISNNICNTIAFLFYVYFLNSAARLQRREERGEPGGPRAARCGRAAAAVGAGGRRQAHASHSVRRDTPRRQLLWTGYSLIYLYKIIDNNGSYQISITRQKNETS